MLEENPPVQFEKIFKQTSFGEVNLSGKLNIVEKQEARVPVLLFRQEESRVFELLTDTLQFREKN